MPIAWCSACATSFNVKPELAGRRVRCPGCKQFIQVPDTTAEDSGDEARGLPLASWLIFGAAVVISLAIGGATGIVVGDKRGKSNDVRELNEAKTRAEGALQRQNKLEAELAATVAEGGREKGRLEAALKEREQQIATAKEAADRAAAQAKTVKENLDTLLAKKQGDAPLAKNKGGARPAMPAEVAGIPTVTAKEIETFGGDLVGQRRQMACRFNEVSDAWVRILLNDNRYVGLLVTDEKGTFFQYCFAKKDKYGKELVDLKVGTGMRLIGAVARVKTEYVFLVDEILR